MMVVAVVVVVVVVVVFWMQHTYNVALHLSQYKYWTKNIKKLHGAC